MKNSIAIFLLLSQSAFAADLKSCEDKIAKMLSHIKTSEVQLDHRTDTYFMSSDSLCGVELAGKALTVSKFKTDSSQREKFETIILNGNDPTFTNRRVKATVSCSMTENSVEYTTLVPVLTDGVKSPFAIEKLTMIQEGNSLKVVLRASLTPINGVFKSITDCHLGL